MKLAPSLGSIGRPLLFAGLLAGLVLAAANANAARSSYDHYQAGLLAGTGRGDLVSSCPCPGGFPAAASCRTGACPGGTPSGLYRPYTYFVEVPYHEECELQSAACPYQNVTVRVFDPAIGTSGQAYPTPPRDYRVGNNFDTCVKYTLYDPDDTVLTGTAGSLVFAAAVGAASVPAAPGQFNCTWLPTAAGAGRTNVSPPGSCTGPTGASNCCDLLSTAINPGAYVDFSWNGTGGNYPEPGVYKFEVDTTCERTASTVNSACCSPGVGAGCPTVGATTYGCDDVNAYQLHVFDGQTGEEFNVFTQYQAIANYDRDAIGEPQEPNQFVWYPEVPGGRNVFINIYNPHDDNWQWNKWSGPTAVAPSQSHPFDATDHSALSFFNGWTYFDYCATQGNCQSTGFGFHRQRMVVPTYPATNPTCNVSAVPEQGAWTTDAGVYDWDPALEGTALTPSLTTFWVERDQYDYDDGIGGTEPRACDDPPGWCCNKAAQGSCSKLSTPWQCAWHAGVTSQPDNPGDTNTDSCLDSPLKMYMPPDPNDSTLAPVLPYVAQYMTFVDGPNNPPKTGDTATYRMHLYLYNPAAGSAVGSASGVYQGATGGNLPFSMVLDFPTSVDQPGGETTVSYVTNSLTSTRGTTTTDGSQVCENSPCVVWDGSGDYTTNLPGGGPTTSPIGPFTPSSTNPPDAIMTYDVDLTPGTSNDCFFASAPSHSTRSIRTFWRDPTSKPPSDGVNPYPIGNSRGDDGSDPLAGTGDDPDGGDTPTIASVSYVRAYHLNDGAVVEFATGSEVGSVGFRLLRRDGATYIPVRDEWMATSPERGAGGIYRLRDPGLQRGERAMYLVEELTVGSQRHLYGPFRVSADEPVPTDWRERLPHSERRDVTRRIARDPREGSAMPAPPPMDASPVRRAKITILESGLYKVSAAVLAGALGMDAASVVQGLQNATLRLVKGAGAIPYWPTDDGLIFWGEVRDSIYSQGAAFWLEAGEGKHMSESTAPAPAATAGVATYEDRDTIQVEGIANPSITTDPSASYWMWQALVVTPGNATAAFSHDFELAGLDDAQPAALNIYLEGGSTSAADNDHHVEVRLNGVPVADETSRGLGIWLITVPLDPGALSTGTNTIEVDALLDPGVEISVVYVDAFRFTYARAYEATANAAIVPSMGGTPTTVRGFSNSDVLVFGLGGGGGPMFVPNALVESGGGGYAVTVDAAAPRYAFASNGALKTPSRVDATYAPTLQSDNDGADYVIVTLRAFVQAAERLAAHRRAQGLATKVVDVDSIYDAFSDGVAHPAAVRDYLSHALSRWKTRPRYLLIAADGTFDHRDVYGFGDNLIPPMMASTEAGLFASSSALGDLMGADGIPEIAVGRLPVHSASELENYIDKVMAFEAAGDAEWAGKALVAADDPAENGPQSPVVSAFTADAMLGAAELAKGFLTEQHFLDGADPVAVRDIFLQSFNAGARVLYYIGHGGMDRIAQSGLMTTDDVETLENNDMTPVVFAASCLLGRFEFPGLRTFGERLVLEPHKGAIALIGSSTQEYNARSTTLGLEFAKQLVDERVQRLGDAMSMALEATQARGISAVTLRMHNIIGDPALKLREALAPVDPVGEKVVEPPETVVGGGGGCNCDAARGQDVGVVGAMAFVLFLSRRRKRGA